MKSKKLSPIGSIVVNGTRVRIYRDGAGQIGAHAEDVAAACGLGSSAWTLPTFTVAGDVDHALVVGPLVEWLEGTQHEPYTKKRETDLAKLLRKQVAGASATK